MASPKSARIRSSVCSMKRAAVDNKTAPGVTRARRSACEKAGRSRSPIQMRREKNLIGQAYTLAEQEGLPIWAQDEAGPYQTIPYPGYHWQPEGEPSKQPHEYAKNGTAKLLTLLQEAPDAVFTHPHHEPGRVVSTES